MKTKNKMLAMVEIAVVLCSVFLVTSPVIAVEQTTQEVSTSEVTTTSKDDFVLGIYGNANEDDTIDMRDLTYVKLIFFGKKSETELADAKYDGKINPLDFIQIKLIIVGKEKELTFIDSNDRAETVNMPIESIAVMHRHSAQAVMAVGATDKVVGIDAVVGSRLYFYPGLEGKPIVGRHGKPDYELMAELHPQVVLTYASAAPEAEAKLEPLGINVVRLTFYDIKTYTAAFKILGIILGKEERSNEFIDFYQGYLDIVRERVESLNEEEKKSVYHEILRDYWTCGRDSHWHNMVVMAGGINIFDDITAKYTAIDPEAILDRNPQVVFKDSRMGSDIGGYLDTDTSKLAALRDELISRPGWTGLDAVKNNKVYVYHWELDSSPMFPVGICYFAKWLYPDMFQDLNPAAFHKEWLESYYGLKYKGTWVYPEP